MSNTREFRKNPTQALKMYSQFFLPMKNFLEGQIKKLELTVDIDSLYPINEAWEYFCTEPISNLNRKKNRMKRKDAYDGHLKRPKTGFMWFISEKRVDYLKKNPTAGITDVTKDLSKEWKSLSEKEKDVYLKKYTADKERYENERKEAYDKVKADDQDLIDSKPKKPLNAFLYFLKDDSIKTAFKAEHQKMIAEGINKTHLQFMTFKWEKITAKDKEKYERLAEEDTKRYQTELVEYNKKVAASTSSEKDD
jgi:hypothetical protein